MCSIFNYTHLRYTDNNDKVDWIYNKVYLQNNIL